MDISLTDTVSTIAAILTTGSFVPQAIKVIRTRDTCAISRWMYILFTTGVFFWFIFGLLIENIPIIAANAVTFVLSLVILIVKLREKKVEK